MKILHISTGYPLSFQGGITNYVRMLATEQSNAGIDVSVLGSTDSKKEEYNFKYYDYESKKIKPFSLAKAKDSDSLKKIEEILDREKFDLIHIHMMLDIDWGLVDILKGKYKYIISLHDYFYICPRIILMDSNDCLCDKYSKIKCNSCITKFETNNFSRKVINGINKKTKINIKYPKIKQYITDDRYDKFKELLEGAQILLPVSNRVKEIYINAGIEGEYKVIHIGNYSAELYKAFNCDEYMKKNTIDVVMLGALTYHKGAEVLLKLLKNINNKKIKFHFYGRAEDKYEDLLVKSGLIYHGRYAQDQLSEILRNMDLGLVLSVWEDNAPQVVMELLNNNVPVVGSKLGGIPDFVNEKNGFLFNPYTNSDFNEVIKFFDNISHEKVLLMKSNIKRTKTPNEHLNEIITLYEQLV